MTTTTDVARRPNGHPAAAQSSAVAIRSNQVEFDDKQKAALVAMGVSDKVTRAELAVFFHQCRNLRLDPFSKQIYLIHRRAKEGDRWVEKPTTQIGIDGFRVIRDRICEERGLSVSYEDTTWVDDQGQGYDVWLWDEPPTACKFAVLVDDGKRVRRFPSRLRFNEYAQRNKEKELVGRWRDGHSHQIEKCAEADALRKAFPNDLSGVILEDAAPLDDPDAPSGPQRVTAEEIRAHRPQPVRAEAVTVTPGAPPEDVPPPGDAAPGRPARQAQPPEDPHEAVTWHLDRVGIVAYQPQMDVLTQAVDRVVTGIDGITGEEAAALAARLAKCDTPGDVDVMLRTGEVPGDV